MDGALEMPAGKESDLTNPKSANPNSRGTSDEAFPPIGIYGFADLGFVRSDPDFVN